jgi:hemerythrin-like metal-binding protein
MEFEPKLKPPHHTNIDLGIPLIDKQHRELVDLLNQASSLVFNKTEDATVVRLLNRLIERTVLHFATEEELIREHCTEEEATVHIAKHAEALGVLLALKNKLELDLIKYQIRYKSDMSHFTDHLFSYDSQLANKIKGRVVNLRVPGSGAHRIIEID